MPEEMLPSTVDMFSNWDACLYPFNFSQYSLLETTGNEDDAFWSSIDQNLLQCDHYRCRSVFAPSFSTTTPDESRTSYPERTL